jgi:hypothetical protein
LNTASSTPNRTKGASPRLALQRRRLGHDGIRRRRVDRRGRAGQGEQIHRQTKRQVDAGIEKIHLPPVQRRQQGRGERPERRRGEAAEQRDDGDGPPRARACRLHQRREDRVVERHRRREAEQDRGEHIADKPLRGAGRRHRRRAGDRSGRQHRRPPNLSSAAPTGAEISAPTARASVKPPVTSAFDRPRSRAISGPVSENV